MATGTAEQVAILRDAPLRSGAPSTKVKTKFPPGSTMENRLSSAVVGPAGGQLRMRSDCFVALSLVAVDALAALVAFLRFDRHGRDGSCLKALDRDRFAGLFAEAVRAVLDARQRLVDLCDQLALAVARAQLDSPVGLR